jgi:heme/copper-type cytochrome/quinol oxidase subunit 1
MSRLPSITQAPPEVVTRGVPKARQPWIERTTSADHKTVGELYIATALVMLAAAATEFALMRVQLIIPEQQLIQPEIFNRLMSSSAATFLVLFAIPLALGLFSYIVPLQIGARGVAFPRLNQFSYWLYAAGAFTLYASFLYSAPESGVLGLPPLADTVFTNTHGTDAWIAAMALALAGFTCFAINMIVTLRRMRAPGIAWRRMAPFAWSGAVTSWVLVVIGPVMIAALTMLMIDRQFNGIFFDSEQGGAPLLYEHLAYIFFTGCYLTVLIFAAGVISEILPTFARKPLFAHRAVLASIAALAPLGLLAWMQNMYTAPLDSAWTIGAMAFALSLVVPIGILLYSWIATLWGGTVRLWAATWYALVAISTIVCGLTGELAYSVIPVGWALDNTTATQGDTLYVLVGGGVMGGFAALHYWFPKLSGRLLGEGIGKAALGLMFVGIHLYVIPMFLAGLEGQAVDVFKYYSDQGVDGYNLIASIGVFILVIGILLELGNAAHSWHNGLSARGHDPWLGATLEWFAESPPPPHNFDAVPDVRSPEPLHDIRAAVRSRTEHFEPPQPVERVVPAEPEAEPAASEGGQGETDGGEGTPVA